MRGTIKYDRHGNAEYFLDGQPVSEAKFNKTFPAKEIGVPAGIETEWNRPIVSLGMACDPRDVQEFYDDSVKHGVPTEFDRITGAPIFTSRSRRAKYLKAYGHHDQDGGYMD